MTTTIKLDHITKIEGHARLIVKVEEGRVKKAQLEVYEGARFFEGILKGRKYDEAHIITSRICGVCSQAHTIAALKAVEDAFRVQVSKQTHVLRELLLIGSIIQSHALHLYFLALPDYYGYDSAIAMAAKYPGLVKRGLKIKRIGNSICTLIGGREIHTITAVVGGFCHVPKQEEIRALLKTLKKERQEFVKTAQLLAKLKCTKFESSRRFYALSSSYRYSDTEGFIECVGNKCIPAANYSQFFKEQIKPYSTAKFVTVNNESFMVGALARVNLYHKRLCLSAQKILKQSKHKLPMENPYLNNFCQALEMLTLCDRAIKLLSRLRIKEELLPEVRPRKGVGIAAVEVPRGTLFHEYEFDDNGIIVRSNIITPTTQNLKSIEDDVKAILPQLLPLGEEKITAELEKLIRAYDPCISCSTHFLKVKWE